MIRNQSTTTDYTFGFRKPGSTDTRTGKLKAKAQSAVFIGVDTGRSLSYYLQHSDLVVYLVGYFGQEAVFYDNAIEQTAYTTLTWSQVDLSSTVPAGAKAVIIEVVDTAQLGSNFGLYPGGGTVIELKDPVKWHQWGVVGLNASRIYDLYADKNTHTVHLIGYLISGQWLQHPLADKTPAGADSFTDTDLTADITEIRTIGAALRFSWYSTPPTEYRFLPRKNGTGDDWDSYCEAHNQSWYPVGKDTGDIVEIKIDDVNFNVYLYGLFDDPLLAVGSMTATGSGTVNAGIMQDGTQVQATLTGDGSVMIPWGIWIDVPIFEVDLHLQRNPYIEIDLPMPQVNMELIAGQKMSISVTLPTPQVLWTTGWILQIDAPKPVVELSIKTGSIMDIELELPHPEVEMAVTVPGVFSITIDLPAPQVEIRTLQHLSFSIAVELPAPQMTMTLLQGQNIDIELVAPRPIVEITAFTEAEMAISIDLPHPLVQLVLNQIPVTIIYRGVAMNLSHYAVTDYSGWRFNSLARYQGKVYGANENGLYELGGDFDAGQPIDARLRFGTLDMFKPIMRKARDAWLTYRSTGELALVIVLDEEDEYEDRLTLVDSKIHEERIKEPRGIRNRYHAYEIRNLRGADFSIESLRLLVEQVRRRAR